MTKKTPYTHPFISTGNLERAIIKYLKNQKNNSITNINSIFKETLKRPRTTLRDCLKRLIEKNLVYRPFGHGYKLTEKGLEYYDQVIVNQSGVCSRTEWREGELKTSTHHLNFTSNIKTRPKTLELNEIEKKILNLNNNTQTLYYFKDIVLKITTKKVIFYCPDILGITHDEAVFKAINLVTKYIKLLKIKGLEVDNLNVENEIHFASINNVFANWISKKNDKFELDLGDNIKLWIDRSHGDPELESNNQELMQRFEELTADLKDTEFRLKDIGELKTITTEHESKIDKILRAIEGLTESTANLSNVSNNLIQKQLEEPKIKEKPKYIL